ncbi:MAG TPA: PKD domain-containing protein [Flavobacteriales bacterium]|nr:PKD domain-containing protein [Flavobacteriales bacterium]
MSDKKFDKKIRETLENQEPEATADWGKMKERLAAVAALGALGFGAASTRLISQLSISAAVILGSASLYVVQRFLTLETVVNEEPIEIIIEDGLTNFEDIGPDYGVVYNEETGMLEPVDPEQFDREEQIKQIIVESEEVEERVVVNHENQVTGDESQMKEKDVFHPASTAIPFEVSTKEACVGIKVDFELRDIDKTMNFLWNFGDGSFSTESDPSHVYDDEGVFDVTLSVRSQGTGIIKTRTIESLIEVHPLPEAVFDWTMPRNVVNSGVQVELNNKTKDANSSTWIVDGAISENNTPEFKIPGEYELNLIASNKFGCQDHTTKVIKFGNRNSLNAPARFSPNNDGRYDTFMPFGLEGLSEKWELVISDKNGEIVFSTTDFNTPWQGDFRNGDLVPDGQSFNWTVVCYSHSGKQRLYNDIIEVER